MAGKKSGLGRGLDALMDGQGMNYEIGAVNDIDISKIEVNPFQPRLNFDDEALENLASSITGS